MEPKKLKSFKLLIALFAFTNITHTAPVPTFKEKLCGLLLSPIASSSSDLTKQKAEKLSQKLDPKSNVTVRNLNALGRLLVGYKNTISIPFINCVLVNEQWLQTLSPKARDFVMARSMMYLLSNPYEYTIYKYIFPLLLYNWGASLNEYLKFNNILKSQEYVIYYLVEALSYLLPAYSLRNIEYKMDAKTAIQFDCFDGALEAISDSTKFAHKGSILDRINSKISGIEAVDLVMNIIPFYAHLHPDSSNGSYIHRISKPIKIGELYFPRKFLSPKYLIPGKFSDRQSTLFNFIKNLPIVNLIFDHPKPYKRIRELTELRNKVLKDKIMRENNSK